MSSGGSDSTAGLSAYDGKRLAVVVVNDQQRAVIRGIGAFENDEKLGNILRIKSDSDRSEGNAELIIQESKWNGEIVADTQHDCDFCLVVGVVANWMSSD